MKITKKSHSTFLFSFLEFNEDEYFIRNRQVRERAYEATQALELGLTLNSKPEELKGFGFGGDFDWGTFVDAIDVSKPIMTGHSFGGATTLLAMHSDPRFKAGIVLDGWLFPLRDMKNLNLDNRSVMFVNAESFLNEENLQKMQNFQENQDKTANDAKRTCHYIQGSVHQNYIDAPFVIRVSLYTLSENLKLCPKIQFAEKLKVVNLTL